MLDYTYFKKYYKMIAIDLRKQQALDADPKAIQHINFTPNLDRAGNTRIYFLLEEAKRNYLWIFTRNHKSFVKAILLNKFNSYQYKNDTIQKFKCKAIKLTA